MQKYVLKYGIKHTFTFKRGRVVQKTRKAEFITWWLAQKYGEAEGLLVDERNFFCCNFLKTFQANTEFSG